MPTNPIHMPSGYATAFAIGFADPASGDLAIVETSRPLPVMAVSGKPFEPLTGTSSISVSVGPFRTIPARPVFITLSGNWQGSVTVQRSTDGGITRRPLTIAGNAWGVYRGNACEPVWEEHEEGAALFLSLTIDAGSIDYRLAQ